MEEKKILRNRMKSLRAELSYEEILDASQTITENVVSHYDFGKAENILIYMHYLSEVRTDGIIAYAFMLGKRVFIPKVIEKTMEFREIHALDGCVSGYKGIYEPPSGTEVFLTGKERKKEDTLVIIPGLAFGPGGERLGYGGGFYDRFLKECPSCMKMGIGFDFQCIEEVPVNENDVFMDLLITDKRTTVFE